MDTEAPLDLALLWTYCATVKKPESEYALEIARRALVDAMPQVLALLTATSSALKTTLDVAHDDYQRAEQAQNEIAEPMSGWNYVVTWRWIELRKPDVGHFKTKVAAQAFFEHMRLQTSVCTDVLLCQIIEGRFSD